MAHTAAELERFRKEGKLIVLDQWEEEHTTHCIEVVKGGKEAYYSYQTTSMVKIGWATTNRVNYAIAKRIQELKGAQ